MALSYQTKWSPPVRRETMTVPPIQNLSSYQKAIIEFVQDGTGDLVIQAEAGSGKTSTLVELSRHLTGKVLFCAFNRSIVEELKSRLPSTVDVKSFHSLGLQTTKEFLVSKTKCSWNQIEVDQSGVRYKKIASYFLNGQGLDQNSEGFEETLDGLLDLMRFAQLSLVDPADRSQVNAMIQHFGIEISDPERQIPALPTLLEWAIDGIPDFDPVRRTNWGLLPDPPARIKEKFGRELLPKVSFIDMIWVPNRFDVVPRNMYDFLLVDESQDLSKCQLELILRYRDKGGRIIAVGDKNQAIYSFAGSNSRSMQEIVDRLQATELPLSVCYRCPSYHLDLARQINPRIEDRPNAPKGVIEDIPYNQVVRRAQAGDMILCRTNRPLVSLLYDFWRGGKKARIRGRDAGSALMTILDRLQKMEEWLRQEKQQIGSAFVSLPHFLSIYESRQIANLARKEGTEMQQQGVQDRCACLLAIWEEQTTAGRVRSMEELRDHIQELFEATEQEKKRNPDRDKNVVWLSSIHRAKGLEASTVFILKYDLIPHPMAKTEDAASQEENLRYIALTRSKNTLYFVQGDEKDPEGDKNRVDWNRSPSRPPISVELQASQEEIKKMRLQKLQEARSRFLEVIGKAEAAGVPTMILEAAGTAAQDSTSTSELSKLSEDLMQIVKMRGYE